MLRISESPVLLSDLDSVVGRKLHFPKTVAPGNVARRVLELSLSIMEGQWPSLQHGNH